MKLTAFLLLATLCHERTNDLKAYTFSLTASAVAQSR
jgi:hypothetical protein